MGVVAAAFIFSGCGNQAVVQAPAQKETPVEVKNESPSVISSIKEAMGLGKKMKCTYTFGTGDSKFDSVAYIDGQKYKSASIIAGKVNNTYFDGSAVYSWMEGGKTGTKMTMACINELKSSLPQNQPAGSGPQTVKNPEDQFKDVVNTNCVAADTTVDLTLPSDVTFTDQCEVLKKTMDSIKNVKLPAGVKLPENLPNIPQ